MSLNKPLLLTSEDHHHKKLPSIFSTCKRLKVSLNPDESMLGINDYIKYSLLMATRNSFGFGWKIVPPSGFDGFKTIIDGKRDGNLYIYKISLHRKGQILKTFEYSASNPWGFIPGFPIMGGTNVPENYNFKLKVSQFWVEFEDELGSGISAFSEQFPNTRLTKTEPAVVERFFASQAYRASFKGEGQEELDGNWARICMIYGYMTKNLVATLKPLKPLIKNPKKAEFVKKYIDQRFDITAVELRLLSFEQIYRLVFEPVFSALKLYMMTPGLPKIKVDEVSILVEKLTLLGTLRERIKIYDLHSLVHAIASLDLELITETAFKTLGFLMTNLENLGAQVEKFSGDQIEKIHTEALEDAAEFNQTSIVNNALYPHLIWRHDPSTMATIVQRLADVLSNCSNLQKFVTLGKGKKLDTCNGYIFKNPNFRITAADNLEVNIALKKETGLDFDAVKREEQEEEADDEEGRIPFEKDPEMEYKRADGEGLEIFDDCFYFRSASSYQVVRVPLCGLSRKANTVDVLPYKYISNMQVKSTEYALASQNAVSMVAKDDHSRKITLSKFLPKKKSSPAIFKDQWYMDVETLRLLFLEKGLIELKDDFKTSSVILKFCNENTFSVTLFDTECQSHHQRIVIYNIDEENQVKSQGVFDLKLQRKFVSTLSSSNYSITKTTKGSLCVLTPSTVSPLLHVAILDCKSQSVHYKGWFKIFEEGRVRIKSFVGGDPKGWVLCVEDSDDNIATQSSLFNFMRVAFGSLKF